MNRHLVDIVTPPLVLQGSENPELSQKSWKRWTATSDPKLFQTHRGGGILLGPPRLVGFRGSRVTDHVFLKESRPYLSLVANIGFSLFLFLIGFETDAAVIRRNDRMSPTASFAGMAIRKSCVLEIRLQFLSSF